MLNYCDCGDYCEWCHPELCRPMDAEFSPSEVLAIKAAIEREDENVNKPDRG